MGIAMNEQAAKMYPYWKSMALVMKGEKKEMRKFQVQLEEDAIPIHMVR